MPDITVEIEIYCSCGAGLCNVTTSGQTKGRKMPFFEVEPCSSCIQKAKDSGYSEGYAEGESMHEK